MDSVVKFVDRERRVSWTMKTLRNVERRTGRTVFDVFSALASLIPTPRLLDGKRLDDEQIAALSKEDATRLQVDHADAEASARRLSIDLAYGFIGGAFDIEEERLDEVLHVSRVFPVLVEIMPGFVEAMRLLSGGEQNPQVSRG